MNALLFPKVCLHPRSMPREATIAHGVYLKAALEAPGPDIARNVETAQTPAMAALKRSVHPWLSTTSACGSHTLIRLRLLSTSPRFSHPLRRRLTVCRVVAVSSDRS